MTFLQPWMLLALPLAALPIMIHLINRRRFQTTPWAAMMFLLEANRMSRGYTRVRRWIILALRTIVVATLIFVFTRPLATGPMTGSIVQRLTGAIAADAIVLVDRSPSMQAIGAGGLTKLQQGLAEVADALQKTGVDRLTLIESNLVTARTIALPSQWIDSPETGPSDAMANIPDMMAAALDHIQDNEVGQSEIWIVSDLRRGDWRSDDPRWSAIRAEFQQLGRRVRFRVLAYPDEVGNDTLVQIGNVVLKSQDAESFVSLTVRVEQRGGNAADSIPITFEIDGARSTLDLPIAGDQGGTKIGELTNHLIPVAKNAGEGWGKVSLATDASPANNLAYFSFGTAPQRLTTIVSGRQEVASVLSLASEISSDQTTIQQSQVVAPESIGNVDWDNTTMLLWNAPLPAPSDPSAGLIQSFVDRGGRVIFFPAEQLTDNEMFGVHFTSWQTLRDETLVSRWRGESDLLAASEAGVSMPMGDLRINRYAVIDGNMTSLASLSGDIELLCKVPTDRGGVYFCSTTPAATDSTMAADGVVLYVMLQRAISDAAKALGNTRDLVAGVTDPEIAAGWNQVAGSKNRLSSDYAFDAGVYRTKTSLVAVNRDIGEDNAAVLGDSTMTQLMKGLNWIRVNRSMNESSSLFEEIWRIFLIAMLIAMVAEAFLCLPKLNAVVTTAGGKPKTRAAMR